MIRARIRVDGRLAAVCRRFLGGADGGLLQWRRWARWRDKTRRETLGDQPGASLRGSWVVWWAGQTYVGVDTSGAVRPEMAGLAVERGRD